MPIWPEDDLKDFFVHKISIYYTISLTGKTLCQRQRLEFHKKKAHHFSGKLRLQKKWQYKRVYISFRWLIKVKFYDRVLPEKGLKNIKYK